uniref:Transcriptional regulator n=1 Tax=Heterorhabditis bacteriophora TaxID=37862 RepID=A0A1I7WWB8_HETBA
MTQNSGYKRNSCEEIIEYPNRSLVPSSHCDSAEFTRLVIERTLVTCIPLFTFPGKKEDILILSTK